MDTHKPTKRLLMATSAQSLSTIISTLSKKYKFDEDKALKHLASMDLLPKKMLKEKDDKKDKEESPWASKKAKELAEAHNIVPNGLGTAKNGKWKLEDVEKLLNKPVKEKISISPNAQNLADENDLDIKGRTGSGHNGRIVLKDVERWIEERDGPALDISDRALQEAKKEGISDDELSSIHGSGENGRIILKDIQKYKSDSDKDSHKSDSDSDEN